MQKYINVLKQLFSKKINDSLGILHKKREENQFIVAKMFVGNCFLLTKTGSERKIKPRYEKKRKQM